MLDCNHWGWDVSCLSIWAFISGFSMWNVPCSYLRATAVMHDWKISDAQTHIAHLPCTEVLLQSRSWTSPSLLELSLHPGSARPKRTSIFRCRLLQLPGHFLFLKSFFRPGTFFFYFEDILSKNLFTKNKKQNKKTSELGEHKPHYFCESCDTYNFIKCIPL